MKIKDIKIGDKVAYYDETTGTNEPATILSLSYPRLMKKILLASYGLAIVSLKHDKTGELKKAYNKDIYKTMNEAKEFLIKDRKDHIECIKKDIQEKYKRIAEFENQINKAIITKGLTHQTSPQTDLAHNRVKSHPQPTNRPITQTSNP